MDKSSDSSSDSDSNSSTSWVFVEDTTGSSPKTANTFHLDCSREPIQELTEQDLLSAGSDFESDTDGISVISESEVPVDDPCLNIETSDSSNDSFTVVGKTDIGDNDANTYKDSDETSNKEVFVKDQNEKFTKIMKPLHMLGIGFVLTAVFFAYCSRITTKISKENVDFDSVDDPLYDKIKVDEVASYNKIDLKHCDVADKLYDVKTDLNKDLEEIVDITMTCAFHHKPKNDVREKRIKKCVKKEYNTKKTGSLKNPESIYSETLESIEHHKKVIEIKSEEHIVTNNNEPKTKNFDDEFREHIRRRFSKKENGDYYDEIDDEAWNIGGGNGACYNKRETVGGKVAESENSKDKENDFKLKWNKIKQNQFKNDHKNNPYFIAHGRRTKKPYSKYQKDKQNSDYKDKKQSYDYKDKKHNYADNRKYEFKHNYNKINNKHPKNVKIIVKDKSVNKENKFKEVPNKTAKNKESKYKMTLQKRNNTTTGEWYTNLYKARNQLRKQEHISDWVFDRAQLRNKKRNKAQWYFKWMNIREQLRYKQSYKPYSS